MPAETFIVMYSSFSLYKIGYRKNDNVYCWPHMLKFHGVTDSGLPNIRTKLSSINLFNFTLASSQSSLVTHQHALGEPATWTRISSGPMINGQTGTKKTDQEAPGKV